jgi:hypothetical protein
MPNALKLTSAATPARSLNRLMRDMTLLPRAWGNGDDGCLAVNNSFGFVNDRSRNILFLDPLVNRENNTVLPVRFIGVAAIAVSPWLDRSRRLASASPCAIVITRFAFRLHARLPGLTADRGQGDLHVSQIPHVDSSGQMRFANQS